MRDVILWMVGETYAQSDCAYSPPPLDALGNIFKSPTFRSLPEISRPLLSLELTFDLLPLSQRKANLSSYFLSGRRTGRGTSGDQVDFAQGLFNFLVWVTLRAGAPDPNGSLEACGISVCQYSSLALLSPPQPPSSDGRFITSNSTPFYTGNKVRDEFTLGLLRCH